MVGPQNLKPRALSAFDIALDIGRLGRHAAAVV